MTDSYPLTPNGRPFRHIHLLTHITHYLHWGQLYFFSVTEEIHEGLPFLNKDFPTRFWTWSPWPKSRWYTRPVLWHATQWAVLPPHGHGLVACNSRIFVLLLLRNHHACTFSMFYKFNITPPECRDHLCFYEPRIIVSIPGHSKLVPSQWEFDENVPGKDGCRTSVFTANTTSYVILTLLEGIHVMWLILVFMQDSLYYS